MGGRRGDCLNCLFGPSECGRLNIENRLNNNFGFDRIYLCWEEKEQETDNQLVMSEEKIPYNPYGIYSSEDVAEMMDFIMYGNGEEEGNYLEMAANGTLPQKENKTIKEKPKSEIKMDKCAFMGL